MKIYNREKTQVLENPDLEKGYLQPDQIIAKTIPATEEVQEEFHFITIKEYENGGKDVEKVIDVPYQPAKSETYEYEDIQVYIPYTEKELYEITINKLTNQLQATDYIANKLAEANAEYIVTEDKTKLIELRTKYEKELTDRETWRKEIDSLQEKLKNL